MLVRRPVLAMTLLVPLIPALFIAAVFALEINNGPTETDPVGDFGSWSPSSAEIRARIGAGGTGSYNDQRHLEFAKLFQQRYRSHQRGIGLKFVDDRRIKLMTVHAIPQSDLARVAAAAHDEARSAFSSDYEIVLCETTAVGEIRLGWAKTLPGPSGFDVRFTVPRLGPTLVPVRTTAVQDTQRKSTRHIRPAGAQTAQ